MYTVVQIGRRGISKGELLDRSEIDALDLVIVADENLRHQQNLPRRRTAILELWTNHRPTLEQHFARILGAAESVQPAEIVLFPAFRFLIVLLA